MSLTRPVYLGVDVGTSGCRACAIDAAGQLLASTRSPLPPSRRPAPGHAEQNPDDWWRALGTTLQQLVACLPNAARARALAIDGTSGTLLLCDEHGTPLSPGLMYDDRRGQHAAASIAAHAPPDSAARGGGSALARLLWLNAERPPGRHPGHALHQAEWLTARLLGRVGLGDENNCLKLGFDPRTGRWPAWLADLGVPRAQLPHVGPSGRPLGPPDPALARALGLPQDLQLIAGTTDSVAAALATGLSAPGDAATALGSTLALKVLTPHPVFAAEVGVYSHRILGLWLAGGASNSGGAVLRHFFDDARLRELSARIDPACDSGLDYYPLLSPGERFPINDPAWPPRLTPRPADDVRFLHGLLEGISAIEVAGYRQLQALGAPYPEQVLSTGGGAANTAWQQLRARRLGIPVRRAAHTEAAYGCALLARHGVRGGI